MTTYLVRFHGTGATYYVQAWAAWGDPSWTQDPSLALKLSAAQAVQCLARLVDVVVKSEYLAVVVWD